MGTEAAMGGTALTVESLTDQLIEEARRAYDDADPAVIRRITTDVVDEFWSEDLKVTSFLPVLAMRKVRDMIDAELEG